MRGVSELPIGPLQDATHRRPCHACKTMSARFIHWGLSLFLMGSSALCAPAVSAGAEHHTQMSLAAVPEALNFTGFVVDQAALLSRHERQILTGWLDRFQQMTGHQMAVVTVRTLRGEDIAAFSSRLANRWGVGRKGLDDGIVLVVAPKERKVRIAVGRGLEHALNWAVCTAIIEQSILPAFRQGRMFAGMEGGVVAIISRFKRSTPADQKQGGTPP